MDKLITDELSLGLDQNLRNNLIDNFKKIQQGLASQSDLTDKQIEKLLSDVNVQDKNEVTQARIDANGESFQTLKGRIDKDQRNGETALNEGRETATEVANARISRLGQYYGSLKERIDNESDAINASFNEKLAYMSLVPETFENLADLKNKYPNGKLGVFVTVDNGHKYIWSKGEWKDAGIYQAVGLSDQNKGDVSSFVFGETSLIKNGNFSNGIIDPAYLFSPSTKATIEQPLFGRNWLHVKSTDVNDNFAGVNFKVENKLFNQALSLNNAFSSLKFNALLFSPKAQTIDFIIGYYDSNDNQIYNESLTTRQLKVNSLEELDLSFVPKNIANASYLRLGVVSEKNKLIDAFITDITFKPSFNNDIKWIKNGNLTRLNTGNAVGENGMTLSVLPDFNNKGWLKASWKTSKFARVTWTLPLDKIKKIGSANLLVKLNLFANQDSDNIGIRLSTYGTSTINKQIYFPVKKGKLYKKNITLPLNLTDDITDIKLFVFDITGKTTDGEILISDVSIDLIRPTTIDDSPEFQAVEDLVAFGDSITWGLHSSDNTVNSWTANLMAYADVNITNTAISGATWQHQANKTSGIVDVIKATDVTSIRNIVAFGGTNDFAQSLPIGTIDDTEPTTFYGAMNVGIQSIYERNPKVSIYLVTPMWRARINDANTPVDIETTKNGAGLLLLDYVNAVIDIARKYHLPVLDLYHEFPINKYNSNSLLADGLHPNDDGYVLLAKKIGKFLNAN